MSDAWRAENKGPESLVAIITVTVLSTVFTGARLFVRGKILGKVHLDDYLIIASVPLGELIFGKRLFSSGGGRRTYENYGLGPSGQMRSENIELSRGHKRMPRQQDTVSFDDLDTTTTTAVAKGSQESILGQHDFSGKIMRTDAFTVSIEQTKKKS
ncbi:hypothetical protein COL26b_006139 [Colletotrichum chrysophilum]|uniref:uncharacterized protein n=1 Tax=Colletotrichum chrysophilum TaxID=1836956 RepID=UPI00230174A4|nr:uncharacterized protein COL26b_006139 [Colletotrichum chrysophilum]KAJ0375633.1 hypothetical protein COL26b_006139 [Colletotrichum chrysophilum]